MPNLTLLRRDSFLDHLNQGIKPDTFSWHALFPDAVIKKAEDEIAQFENTKHTLQPIPGPGGFAGGHKKLQQNRYQPYLTGWKNQESSRSSGQTGKDMLAWKSFGGRGRSWGRGRGGQLGRDSRGPKDNSQY